ncbi:nicotinate-nucleotide--dimethylbenzimidazole phosphoribosyltransferase [Streptomyces sp. NPDC001388]|uniref:nicotinate-nucleotide--dimethylbenzimidazole phosphoribosyltransferase n=1 Tax=Streptomyces sp. NPDC001388 TaxID=3364568 RepID=UPI0036C27353
MTDTGQVPGEGLPENAGMVEQPGAPAHGAYTYLSETTAEDEDLLLLPGAQSAWGNEVAPPAPEPVVETVHEPGPHELSGRDSGSVDLSAVRLPGPAAPPQPAPRRPLHLGPPIPDTSSSPVRSLADRGPAGAPVRQAGPPVSGPEYLDVPPLRDTPPQGAAPWGAQATAPAAVPAQGPAVPGATPAETAVPVPAAGPVAPEPGQVGAAEAVVARVATEAIAATAQQEAESTEAAYAGSESGPATTPQVPGALTGEPAQVPGPAATAEPARFAATATGFVDPGQLLGAALIAEAEQDVAGEVTEAAPDAGAGASSGGDQADGPDASDESEQAVAVPEAPAVTEGGHGEQPAPAADGVPAGEPTAATGSVPEAGAEAEPAGVPEAGSVEAAQAVEAGAAAQQAPADAAQAAEASPAQAHQMDQVSPAEVAQEAAEGPVPVAQAAPSPAEETQTSEAGAAETAQVAEGAAQAVEAAGADAVQGAETSTGDVPQVVAPVADAVPVPGESAGETVQGAEATAAEVTQAAEAPAEAVQVPEATDGEAVQGADVPAAEVAQVAEAAPAEAAQAAEVPAAEAVLGAEPGGAAAPVSEPTASEVAQAAEVPGPGTVPAAEAPAPEAAQEGGPSPVEAAQLSEPVQAAPASEPATESPVPEATPAQDAAQVTEPVPAPDTTGRAPEPETTVTAEAAGQPAPETVASVQEVPAAPVPVQENPAAEPSVPAAGDAAQLAEGATAPGEPAVAEAPQSAEATVAPEAPQPAQATVAPEVPQPARTSDVSAEAAAAVPAEAAAAVPAAETATVQPVAPGVAQPQPEPVSRTHPAPEQAARPAQAPATQPEPEAQPVSEPAAPAVHQADPASQSLDDPAPVSAAPQAETPAEVSAEAPADIPAAVPVEVPGGAPAEAPAAPVGMTPSAPHPDQPMGAFVPVEGSVPTTPHLAPTPQQAPVVPPEDQWPAETASAQPGIPAQAPGAPAPTVPAPRAADTAPAPATPDAEPAADAHADPDPEVAQSPEDLDTRAADQEESTAPVEEVTESTGPAAPGYDDAEREAVLKVMRERRDIRNGFRSDPIPHEVLLRVLEAAHTAPSVGHSQPWDFVVIRSADTRRAMHELAMRQRDAYAKSLPKGRAKQFKELKIEAILDTPVNIVVTADPTRGGRHTLGRHTQPQMAPYSSALAVENLWLAARAEGLGVGWVSFFDEREMVRALGLPEHLEVVAYLCVGYVDEFPDEPELMQAGWAKRRPLSWVVHEETYGRRALPGEDPHDLLAETVAGIRPLDAKALGEAWERQKRMTKPAGALGMLEIISAQLSGLSRQCPPPIPEPAAVAIFAGDHGVHAQGVTPWPQEVTAQMVANFLGGGAVCNAFATQVGAEVCVVDVGVAADLPATPGLLPRKIRAGTSDMTTGPAMTREEAKQAIEVGIETARDLVAAGNKALLTGEMGIANTTASAALISVFTGADPAEVTGRGTGINDETLARKTEVVRRALELHQPDPADPIGVLAAIGGFEHAAMVGLLLGGASLRTPVILDGVSAGAAALVARAIAPEVLAACIAGHRSAEPGHVAALNKLGLRPLVDLDLRLGEGTGALLALPLVQSTARAMHEVATFDSAGVTEK